MDQSGAAPLAEFRAFVLCSGVIESHCDCTIMNCQPELSLPEKWRGICIHQVVEAQADKAPNAIAVSCEGERLTYRQLNARANQLAHYLQRNGVGPETPVALCVERSLDMVVAILAVLKAGGAYVPIDLAYPKERLAFMLEDTRAPVLLTQESLRSSLPENSADVICIDSQWAEISRESDGNLDSGITAENAAYIIFTSGSTGKPKGVLVTHGNVVRLFTQTEHWYAFNARDVWTLFHSCAFDFSVWEIWGALFYGGRLVVVPYLTSRSPSAFYELLAKEGVTVLNQTPSAFRQLIWAEANAAIQKLSLRYVIFGGEALELQSLKPWFDRHGDKQPLLVNMYGITETTVHVTYRPIRMQDLTDGLGSVIGVAIPDLQLHVLDENLKPVPPCTPGEMFIGGAGVARGYLNRPELTALRFVDDPFATEPGAKLYRSGDLAQRLPNGELEYLGRIDHQVKIRGFRIELGEIETALNRHPGIRENVVVAHDSSTGDKRLVAYVVAKGETPSISGLREFLSQKIPEYMVPAVFVFLEALPLTPNGKVDRRALPSSDERARPAMDNAYVPPRTPTEQALAETWSDVLELERVGIRDNFFDLGGDSISCIACLSRAQQRGLNFSVQQLFQNPTIEALATCIDSSETRETFAATAPFSLIPAEDRAKLSDDIEDAYPMIQLQTGMFYYNELNPLSAVYHDVFSFRIHAAFDGEKLETAVNRLVDRHPVLRTSFHLSGFSEPMQCVHREVQAPFTVEDLRQLSSGEQRDNLVQWIETEKRRPFDRTVAPLIRFHTQIQSDQCFQFICSFHHVYLDGWSLAALMTEIFQDYAALLEGTTRNIAPPRIAYRDFVALERKAVAAETVRRFWTEKFADAPVQMLPRWPKSMCAGGHEQVRGPEILFDPEVLNGLKRLAQNAGVPLKTVLLAAHQRVMASLYGQSDVTSGLVCNGRPEEIDGEKLIGLFLNTLPIRTQLQRGSWVELVKQTFAAEQEIMAHRRFPLAEIQKLHGGRPLFEAAFDFVHFHVYKNLQGYRDLGFVEGHYFEANNLTTLTTFMLDVTSTQLQLHLDYDPNALCLEQIRRISNYYVNTVKAMAADPEGRYEKFSPLSEEEEQQLLVAWNSTEESYPRTECIHHLVEAQAKDHPESVAVVFENQTLTYRELNLRANRVARQLKELGVAAEALVGLYVQRSAEMVVGLLGILKAGAAYVPLDPAYPKDRLADMIADAQMPVIVTESKLASTLPASSAKVVCLDSETVSRQPDENISSEVMGSNLAYVIYTSGSTGKPKGVQIEHRSVVNLLTSMARTIRVTPADDLLAVTTFSFDIAALEIFLPLISGGKLTVVSREKAADGTALASLIDSSPATIMQATPVTWRLLIEAGWRGKKDLKILCGGEALSRKLADDLLERASAVWNVYGPTETTIWSTAWKVAPGEPISIGRPLANTQTYILDPTLQPVPVGVTGELHIGGDGLARGYFNRPELTAEKFIPNPLDPARRIYKTGDLARYLPDGRMECLGRLDHQVKIRGFRIELGDIEAALRAHPAVRETVVMAREDVPGDKRLVAYLVAHNGSQPSPSELRDFLKAKLPDYMVPAAFVELDAFPLTPAGKIDRKALPAPDRNCGHTQRQFVPPQTPIESDLAAIWREVFRTENISVEDNFFDLGGHSLTAVQLIVRMRGQFGVDLPLTSLFEAPTIRGLAEVVLKALADGSDHALAEALREISGISEAEAKELLALEDAKNT
jgi:amino acid adenylation domain-containing protein